MGLCERNDELALAKKDLERAVQLVEELEQMLKDLPAAKEDYEEERKKKQQEYQDYLAKMEAEYEHMSQELREEFRKNITAKFDEFKVSQTYLDDKCKCYIFCFKFQATFSAMRQNYYNSFDALMKSIDLKMYGLKSNSINLRSMFYLLFTDYCDALFYFGFEECNTDIIPVMADDFETLLSKLNDLRWDIISNVNNIPGGKLCHDIWVTKLNMSFYHRHPFILWTSWNNHC